MDMDGTGTIDDSSSTSCCTHPTIEPNYNRKRPINDLYDYENSANDGTLNVTRTRSTQQHKNTMNSNSNTNSIRSTGSMIILSSTICNTLNQHRLAPVYIGIPSTTTTSKNRKDRSTIKSTRKATMLGKILQETFDNEIDTNNDYQNGDTTTETTTVNNGKTVDVTNSSLQMTSTDQATNNSSIVYKIYDTDTGLERRMTSQEKKHAKLQHKLYLKQQQQLQQQQLQVASEEGKDLTTTNHKDTHHNNSKPYNDGNNDHHDHDDDDDDDEQEQQDEPPVMLSSAMAQILIQERNLLINQQRLESQPHTNVPVTTSSINDANQNKSSMICKQEFQFDDQLSQQWAESLHNSMIQAVHERQQENTIRIMPYHIVPTVWERLRPKFVLKSNNQNVDEETKTNICNGSDTITNHDWLWCNMSPRYGTISNSNNRNNYSTIEDDDHYTVLHFLHTSTNNIHISCGAKFGCDYLLYDGPRHERHAFAGLRIVSNTTSSVRTSNGNNNSTDYNNFPNPPNPYDLYGYVRCLNTAGKLALLATTITSTINDITVHKYSTNIQSQQQPELIMKKILIVDLVLEKIATTTSRRPKKTMDQRLKNLSKK